MSNVYDAAVIAWANDRLAERDHPKDAVELRFEGWDGCYSEWTVDLGVGCFIVRQDGSEVYLDLYMDAWHEVLKALPAYVAAEQQMEELHKHGWDDEETTP